MNNDHQNTGRVSQCISHSLLQLKNKDENPNYPITTNDLIYWHHCPICYATPATRISEVYLNDDLLFFTTDLCETCYHIYRAISPNSQWFVERWKQIATGMLSVYNSDLEVKRKIRYELYFGILHKYKQKGLVLDVGAAYGSGTSVFLERGFRAEALEPEQDRADYIKHTYNIQTYQDTIEDFSTTPEKYDLILFSHCLEHITDPLDCLQKLKSYLKNDGFLYIEIPIAWKIIDWQDAFFMAHKHNFIEKNMITLLSKMGLNIVDRFLIPDNDGPFCNLAFIVTKSQGSKIEEYQFPQLMDPITFKKEDLINLYRIHLPCDSPKNGVLKYSVPHINHFYHILRKNRTSFQYDGNFIRHIV